MATVSPTTNLATSTRYAVRSKDIFVNTKTVASGTTLGNSDLETTLGGIYGKVYLAEPTNPKEGDLWYDHANSVLKYCSAAPVGATPAEWTPIFNGAISGKFYSATSATSAGAEAAAKAELYAHHSDPQPSAVGDIVIVTITGGTESGVESYICVGVNANPSSAADYTVYLTTTDQGSEIEYDAVTAGHYLTAGSSVTDALTTLGNQMYNNCDYGRFTVTEDSDASGTIIAADTGDFRGMPDKDFTGFTGMLKFTCCINCTASGAAYSTFGVVTAAVVDGAIESDSLSLVDYYVKGTGHPTGTEADVFNIDFEIDSTTHLLSLTVPNTSTVKAGTTITVKAQW